MNKIDESYGILNRFNIVEKCVNNVFVEKYGNLMERGRIRFLII